MKKQTPAYTLRPLSPTDAPLLEEFFAALGPESRALFNRRDYNKRGVLRAITHPDPAREYYLAEKDGRILGYVFFLDASTGVPELGVCVRDDCQGKGLGRTLCEWAIDTAHGRGKGGLMLTTHTANLRAQVLYESLGFSCLGLTKNGTELFYLLRFRAEK